MSNVCQELPTTSGSGRERRDDVDHRERGDDLHGFQCVINLGIGARILECLNELLVEPADLSQIRTIVLCPRAHVCEVTSPLVGVQEAIVIFQALGELQTGSRLRRHRREVQ